MVNLETYRAKNTAHFAYAKQTYKNKITKLAGPVWLAKIGSIFTASLYITAKRRPISQEHPMPRNLKRVLRDKFKNGLMILPRSVEFLKTVPFHSVVIDGTNERIVQYRVDLHQKILKKIVLLEGKSRSHAEQLQLRLRDLRGNKLEIELTLRNEIAQFEEKLAQSQAALYKKEDELSNKSADLALSL